MRRCRVGGDHASRCDLHGAVMNKPLALSDHQMATAAALLAPSARSDFLRSVAGRLVDNHHPSDHDIAKTIGFILVHRTRSAFGKLIDYLNR